MNSFMNALYQDGVGRTVTGNYYGAPFIGTISNVRSSYGNGLNVYVDLESPIVIHGREREALVLDGSELFEGFSPVAENLHVYF